MMTKDEKKEYSRLYWIKNKEKLSEACKKWKKKNPDKTREYNKEWRKKNPNKVKELKKQWIKNNPEKWTAIIKRWQKKNPEKTKKYNKKWRINNSSRLIEVAKKWQKDHPDKAREHCKKWDEKNKKEYLLNKTKEDPLFYFKSYLLSKIVCRLPQCEEDIIYTEKDSIYERSIENMLGISIKEFIEYMEGKFTDGMTWSNRGTYWNISFWIPLSSAKTKEETMKLMNYKNLRPLQIIAYNNKFAENKIWKDFESFKTSFTPFKELEYYTPSSSDPESGNKI